MDTPKQQRRLAGNINSEEQKEHLQISKELRSTSKKATEQLLRQIFTRHKKLPESSNEELTQEVSRAFQLFRREFSDLPGPKKNAEKERQIRERLSNLQKRTSATLEVLTNCKENMNSVVFLETKPKQSGNDESVVPETRSLDQLTEEIKKIQTQAPSSSVMSVERPDMDHMKNATDQLLDELGRISKSYASGKKPSWLSKATGTEKPQ